MSKSFFKLRKEKSLSKWFLFLFSFVILVGLVSAIPPVTTVQQINAGYIIYDSPQTLFSLGQSYQYNFFISNISNGALKLNDTVSCTFYLANSTGKVIFQGNVPYKPEGYWGLDIDGGNFSKVGFYNYGTRCNSSSLAGVTVGLWEITQSGETPVAVNNPNFFWLILVIAAGIIFLGFAIKNAPITILGSFGLIYVGLYIIINGINGIKDSVYTWGWGIIILAVAGYIGIKSAYEMIQDSAE